MHFFQQMTPEQYLKMCRFNKDPCRILENYLKCELCNNEVVKDSWILSKHMKQYHGITLFG